MHYVGSNPTFRTLDQIFMLKAHQNGVPLVIFWYNQDMDITPGTSKYITTFGSYPKGSVGTIQLTDKDGGTKTLNSARVGTSFAEFFIDGSNLESESLPVRAVLKVGTKVVRTLDFTSNVTTGENGGVVGPQGPQGIQGPAGPQGPIGPTGPAGPQGPQGESGPQGLLGPKGNNGDAGPQGPQGIKGDTGSTGPQGLQGVKGDTGTQGPQGIQGVAGPKGDAGAAGPQGIQGLQGVKGDKGDTGAAGSTGAQGPKGDTGATGPQGPKGDTGATGPAGADGAPGTNAGTIDSPIITVASATASAAVKALCDYVCTGTNDQVQINQALLAASRSADGFGGTGRGVVELVGPRFFVANDDATPITMYPSTHLKGSGWNTIITPMWSTNVDRGAIELVNTDTAHVLVSDLMIGRHNAVASNGHGIKFVNNGSASVYEVKTGNDPFNQIRNVCANLMSKSGFYVTGSTGGNRESQISHCLAWSCGERGFYIDSSDCQISDCRATGGGNYARFELAGGNVKIANCKAYFSGNRVGDGTTADGFLVSSSRISITNCDAQDCGRYGFYLTGQNVTAVGLVADSNSRSTTGGGGFFIAADGMYEGMHAHNRAQNSITQNRPFIFSGSRNLYLTGRSELSSILNGPGTHINGTAPTGYVRILKDGSAGGSTDGSGLYSVG